MPRTQRQMQQDAQHNTRSHITVWITLL